MISIVIIGASTGGPSALASVLSRLPADFPVPVAVVQHILPDFSGHFAKRLEKKCSLVIKEGEHRELLRPGHVYIAPAKKHMIFKNEIIKLDDGPRRNHFKPSIDVTMESAAKSFGRKVIGIVLTGAGTDGVKGLEAIKHAKGITIAQDKRTSVIYNLPRKSFESGNVDYILPLEAIADKIMELVNAR